jgi:hypothetical protein
MWHLCLNTRLNVHIGFSAKVQEHSRSVFDHGDMAIVGFSNCITPFEHEDQTCFLASTCTVSHYLPIPRGALCSTRTAVIDAVKSRESINSGAAQLAS